jgi:serine/threonine protein kinase
MNIAPRVDPLPVGTVLRRRFELTEVIGRGGICTVYRAIDRMRVLARAPDPQVAIKLVSVDAGADRWLVEMVHREAHYLRQLVHPNIVRVFDSDEDGPVNFLVLELLRGRGIGQILKDMPQKTLPFDLALRVIAGAAAGLNHAHERGIVHGDLKPNNVFVTADGEVKLLDFGAARLLDRDAPGDAEPVGAGEFDAITPMYASPEMLRGEIPNQSDDVFSLGVLTYVMIAGNHPFGGATAQEAWRLRLRPEKPLGLSSKRWHALARAIAFEHAHRTEGIAAFVKEFSDRLWWRRLLG